MTNSDTKPIISVCVPTYNRVEYLQICLDSITRQFTDINLYRRCEIIISDNNSKDNTYGLIKKYQKKYRNIRYHKNKKNIGGDRNLYKAGTLAKGKYLWFFSDDDIFQNNSLNTVLNVIKHHTPDVIIPNMDLYTIEGNILIDKNLLRNDEDIYIKTKKSFFSYLETKFFLPLDWHIGVYSNTIVRRDLFIKNGPKVLFYGGQLNHFAHTAIFYYFPDDFKIYITAKSLVKFRADNRSFGDKDTTVFLKSWYSLLNKHYKILCEVNKKHISVKFKILLGIKKFIRDIRLLLLRFVKFDIAGILMKIFYKDAEGRKRKWSISV